MRLSARLMWTFASLFVFSGVLLLLVGKDSLSPGNSRLLAGLATSFLGGFGLCLAWNAWETGHINVQHFRYSRASQPKRFVATVILIVAAGCGTLASAVWFLFFKQ